MNNGEFHSVVDNQIKTCVEILDSKSSEYAEDGDRLHNFKIAAKLQECSVQQALAGMMAKHTISIYDMCRSRGTPYEEIKNEKITDSINYLLLLKASLVELQADMVEACFPNEPLYFCAEGELMDECAHYSMASGRGCNNPSRSLEDK